MGLWNWNGPMKLKKKYVFCHKSIYNACMYFKFHNVQFIAIIISFFLNEWYIWGRGPLTQRRETLPPNPGKTTLSIFWEISIRYQYGCNQDGVIAKHWLISHQLQKEKPWELFLRYSLTNSLGTMPQLCRKVSYSGSTCF